jgi:hypothetical protein
MEISTSKVNATLFRRISIQADYFEIESSTKPSALAPTQRYIVTHSPQQIQPTFGLKKRGTNAQQQRHRPLPNHHFSSNQHNMSTPSANDLESTAQRIVNITLTNYFRQKAIEHQQATEQNQPQASMGVTPTEKIVFDECKNQAITRGIFGFVGSAVPTALIFHFATKFKRVPAGPVVVAAVFGGFYCALSNTRECMINFLAIPATESEVATLCRKALVDEALTDSMLWKDVQERMKKSGSSRIASDYKWKKDDDALAKSGAGERERNELILPGSSKEDLDVAGDAMLVSKEEEDASVPMGEEGNNENWTLDNYLDDGLREEYDQEPGWIDVGDSQRHEDDGEEERKKTMDRTPRTLRVDEQYDLLYEGGGGQNAVWGKEQPTTQSTTWEEIRARRR